MKVDPSPANFQEELSRRHKAAATTVVGLLVATALLCIVAYLGRPYYHENPNPTVEMAVWITIFLLGIGSIVWRRTKFNALRLQDIGALQGAQGLLRTLEKTTLQVTLLSAGIVTVGFIATLVTGIDFYTYRAAAITAAFMVFYCYPSKRAWTGTIQRFTEQAEPALSPNSE